MTYVHRTALAAAALMAIGLGSTAADAATRELRYAEFGPDRGTRAQALKWFDEELRSRTDGDLGLDITWGGTLLGAKNAIEGVGSGVADMASVVPVYEPGRLVAFEVPDVRQIADEWIGMRATYDVMANDPQAQKDFAGQGVRFISTFTTGPTQLLSRAPITTVAELDGKKIRATGNFGKAFEANGAAAVSMSQPDVYQSLTMGAIDGTAAYAYVIAAYKHYEAARHLTMIDMGQNLGWGIVMNARTWDSLTPDQQAVVTDLGSDFVDHLAKEMIASRTAILEKLKTGIDGTVVQVHEGTEALNTALIDAAEEAGRAWLDRAADKGIDGPALLGTFNAALDKYAADQAENGYPWEGSATQ